MFEKTLRDVINDVFRQVGVNSDDEAIANEAVAAILKAVETEIVGEDEDNLPLEPNAQEAGEEMGRNELRQHQRETLRGDK